MLLTASGSNSDDRNNRKLFNVIVDGGKFTMKRKEEITSVHYFVRVSHQITLTLLLMKHTILSLLV